jgi:hypothetical protein
LLVFIQKKYYDNLSFFIREIKKKKKTEIDKLGWPIVLILTIFFDPLVQGINRILRGNLIIGVIWIITGGIFGIGWIIDIICMVLYKDIKFLA